MTARAAARLMRQIARTGSIVSPAVIARTSSPLREFPVWCSVVFITGSFPELTSPTLVFAGGKTIGHRTYDLRPGVLDWHARGPRWPGPGLRTGDVVLGGGARRDVRSITGDSGQRCAPGPPTVVPHGDHERGRQFFLVITVYVVLFWLSMS